jgi:HPt (histidine-containing phosphotransfer) domain-containing protein
MDIIWNTSYIDPQSLISISRGDRLKIKKYLIQFQELIPDRIESLKKSLEQNDRKLIRQILHQMSPQLQFFGIPDVVNPIRRLEFEYEIMPFLEMEFLVGDILEKLELAVKEVNLLLKKYFE